MVWLGVNEREDVPVPLTELVPDCVSELLPLTVPVRLAVREGEAEPVPLLLPVCVELLLPVGVAVGVSGTTHATTLLTSSRLASKSSTNAVAENVTARAPLLNGSRTL